MNKYVIMGPQGCGKGTQARMLADDLSLVHISIGDILRWHIENHTKLGTRVRRVVASGELVPGPVVEQLVRERLDLHDWNYGFVLDGFPRDAEQAEFLLGSYDIDAVVLLDVPREVLLRRLGARRPCAGCGLDYNLLRHRPRLPDHCDACGGRLVQRPDDAPEVLVKRLAEFDAKTRPVLDLFRRKTDVIEVDGSLSPEVVQRDLRRALDLPMRPPMAVVRA